MASVVFSKQHTGIYWSVGILVGILSIKEFGGNSFRFGGKPFFPQNGGLAPQKGGHDPPFEEKGVPAKKIIPKCTDQVFLRYWFGKYQEIPTEYRPKLPNWYTTLPVVGDVTYGLLVQIYCLTVTIFNAI
jgi:hypothetical protein